MIINKKIIDLKCIISTAHEDFLGWYVEGKIFSSFDSISWIELARFRKDQYEIVDLFPTLPWSEEVIRERLYKAYKEWEKTDENMKKIYENQ